MDNFWALIGSCAFGPAALGVGVRLWHRGHAAHH
jgi:hypothetical protein